MAEKQLPRREFEAAVAVAEARTIADMLAEALEMAHVAVDVLRSDSSDTVLPDEHLRMLDALHAHLEGIPERIQTVGQEATKVLTEYEDFQYPGQYL